MSPQRAGGEGPGRHEGADVRRRDLIERAESLQIVGAASHRPLALLIGCRSDRDERDRHCGDSPGSPTANHFDNRHLPYPLLSEVLPFMDPAWAAQLTSP